MRKWAGCLKNAKIGGVPKKCENGWGASKRKGGKANYNEVHRV